METFEYLLCAHEKVMSILQIFIFIYWLQSYEVVNSIFIVKEKAQIKKHAQGDRVTSGTAGIWIRVSGRDLIYIYVAWS